MGLSRRKAPVARSVLVLRSPVDEGSHEQRGQGDRDDRSEGEHDVAGGVRSALVRVDVVGVRSGAAVVGSCADRVTCCSRCDASSASCSPSSSGVVSHRMHGLWRTVPHPDLGSEVPERLEPALSRMITPGRAASCASAQKPGHRSRRPVVAGAAQGQPASDSSDSRVTRPVSACGAVWRSRRTRHERSASKTTRATRSDSSSAAALVRASSSW